ncbi:MAG TPA: glycosyltransferase [Devosia sp.]|jgi:glycosyltransferase involved in cell wall biosynthesis|uniref:glycosyltransferase n=1 Tax=Devosia sp. TaxID=1871048 RepID=UPI002DDCDB7B|nr:glycosyltransferase [Devosia sp.]HEV2518495.1 glycosyltransferase [Devosia sp.]
MTERRALFIAPATPARAGNGLAMRLGIFQDALAEVAEVETLVLPVSGPPPDERFTNAFGATTLSVSVAGRFDTQFALLSRIADPAERLRQFRFYGRGSRHAALSGPVLAEMKHALAGRHYDLAHIGRLYLADSLGSAPAPRLSLDLDEDDAWAWRRLAAAQTPDEAAWSAAEAEAEDRLLARRGPAFAALFVSGPADAAALAERHPGLRFDVVANAIAFPAAPARRDDGATVLFVGAFGYRPNVEGVLWFIREVWPGVRARAAIPPRLLLVGRDPPAELQALDAPTDGIEVRGPVDDIATAYAAATLAIAPLHAGAGTRLKLIEAAAHGVPLVTTRLAARGLDCIDAETAWLADGSTPFADAVLAALADPATRRRRAELARQRAQAAHDRVQVVAGLARVFADMLQTGDAAQGHR